MKGIFLIIANIILFLGTIVFSFRYLIERSRGTNSKFKIPAVVLLIIITLSITFTSGVGGLYNHQAQLKIESEIKWSAKMNDDMGILRLESDKKELDKDLNERLIQCIVGYASIITAFAIRRSIDKEKMDYVKHRWNWDKVK